MMRNPPVVKEFKHIYLAQLPQEAHVGSSRALAQK
jgi:hypothetical protein